MNRIICGVDVSKAWLDCRIRPGNVFERYANDADGIGELARLCKEHGVDLVVMEASGGYERTACLLLPELGVACALANARSVRRFAEAMGLLEKTDRIDAGVIAHYAEVKDLQPMPAPKPSQQRLSALVARLAQVSGDLTVNKQRLDAARHEECRESLREVMALLQRQSRKLAGEIASLIDDDPLWSRLDAAFREIKGVADRTVARLTAELPEIGLLDGKAIAKLAGLAPIADDSGKRAGNRRTRGGRAGPRGILFLAAGIAAKYEPRLIAFKEKLQAAGKPRMVVRIALARKLLVILNAKARDARREFANAT